MSDPKQPERLKNWGRIWRITIRSLQTIEIAPVPSFAYTKVMVIEQKGWTPEGLHITFDMEKTFTQAYWQCDISIYNLNAPVSQDLIKWGMTCTVEAGYQSTGLGTVFEGTIFQPKWEKEEGTDWNLTLHCIIGVLEVTNNFIGHTVAGGVTQRDLVSEMVRNARYPLGLNIDKDIAIGTRTTRATTYFGQPNDLLQCVADTNECFLWFSHLFANMFKFREADNVPQWEYGIENGLVGTPHQTDNGVALRVLLNPDIQLLHQIKLKRATVIKQLTREIGKFPSIITEDYTYIVGGIRHIADSRGNDWYTEIIGYYNPSQMQILF